MALTILQVSLPHAQVGIDSAGGGERVLSAIDRALVRMGHRSIVIAPVGSRVEGTLIATPQGSDALDGLTRKMGEEAHDRAIRAALAAHPIDVVHLHGMDFDRYLPPPGPPVLASLHLPPSWYEPSVFRPDRPDTFLHAVSRSQHGSCPASPALLDPIENGVELAAYRPSAHRGSFALMVGRICPEKGFEHGLIAAERAGSPLLLAGWAVDYPEHHAYFERTIRPRLSRERRFLGPLGLGRRRRLLGRARCVLIPSLVPETSSFVAMEALASGTPVIAFRRGALAEIIEHGRTGFLVDDALEMAGAIREIGVIRSADCRSAAEERFSEDRMIGSYLERYARLASIRKKAA